MLLRSIVNNSLSGLENSQNEPQLEIGSKIVEELIETSLEHFANEDATLLAEAYHIRVGSERSLFILARCLTRARSFENAYHLLKTVCNPITGLRTAKCRYLFAYCAFKLNRLQEAENTLRDNTYTSQIKLHPSFQGTQSLAYAHSLLGKVLCETNRMDSARVHWAQSIKENPIMWTSMRSFCDIGGELVKELQPTIDEFTQWQKKNAEDKNTTANAKQLTINDKEDNEDDGCITAVRTLNRNRGRPSKPNSMSFKASITSNIKTTTERRKTRLRNTGADSHDFASNNLTESTMALRASENSPFVRANKLTGVGRSATPLIIEQQKQHNEKEEQMILLQQQSNKRITRRATAEAVTKHMEMQKLEMQQQQQQRLDWEIYYELLNWLLHLAEVQYRLSQYRCTDALQLLNTLNPLLSRLPLSLELRARVFFENGEYKRSCEVFEELRRLYPRRIDGLEIYSTALWQLHDSKKLSALAAEMTEIAREQPGTWCIAGNCFSLEKQHETSIECLERAIRLDHRFGYAYSLLGHELISMNDLSRAEQAFRKAIVHSPNDYRAWYGLGLVHFREEKMQEARGNLQKAVEINSTNTALLCQLAVIEQAQHCNKTAMECLERALKYQPNNVPCRFHKARLLFDMGRYEEAKAELEELKLLSPDEAHVFFLLGRVHRKLGNNHQAVLNFSWATEIDPRGEQNQSALTTDKGPYDDEPID